MGLKASLGNEESHYKGNGYLLWDNAIVQQVKSGIFFICWNQISFWTQFMTRTRLYFCGWYRSINNSRYCVSKTAAKNLF